MQYVRNQIASDLHDEVGSNLNSIAIFVQLFKKKIPKANSIKGYTKPYLGITFDNGSYIPKLIAKPFTSNNLKKLKTM